MLALTAAAAAAAASVALALPASATISPASSPAPGVSFTVTGSGNTAGWALGSNHPDAVLHLASTASNSNAAITVTNIPANSEMPTTAPTFATTGYAAGTPRLEIQAGDGSYEAAYPASVCGQTAPAVCWASPVGTAGTSYDATYGQVRAYVDSHGGVLVAFVVADASQAPPYTADVTALSWGTTTLVPGTVANSLTAKDVCGSYANRHWTVTSVAGADVTFYAKTRLNSGAWRSLGHAEQVTAAGSVSFVTTRGTTLRLGFANGLGAWDYATFPAHVTAC